MTIQFPADVLPGPGAADGGTFNPAAIELTRNRAYDDHAQSGAEEFALSGAAHVGGSTATVRITGDGSDFTVDGSTVFWADGTVGAKTWTDKRPVAFWYHPAIGAALAFVPGDGGGGTWGSITGTLADQTDLQAALDAKAPTANPTFTGTVGIPDGALAIADTNGLQAALDAKQTADADLTALAALTAPATKLSGIEASADVTDATNVAAAGAVMTTGAQLVSVQANNDLTANPKFWLGTQAEYDALTPTAGELYLILEA